MATYTAGDQITRALRLLGVLAEDETPSSSMAQDALVALNQMIDSWNTERLSVFNTQDQVFEWEPGVLTQTLGPTGTFVGNRPVLIDDATYYLDPGTGVSYGIKFINQQQYDGIAVKTVTSTYPQVCWGHIISIEELTQPATLDTELHFPPGYMRAFTYNLAMEIAPEFGVEPSQQVQRIAMTSKRNLKRITNPDDVMSLPYAIVATRQRFNIYAGNY